MRDFVNADFRCESLGIAALHSCRHQNVGVIQVCKLLPVITIITCNATQAHYRHKSVTRHNLKKKKKNRNQQDITMQTEEVYDLQVADKKK